MYFLPNEFTLSVQKFKSYWKKVLSLSSEKDIFFNASAITFNLFICAIPFTLILISIIGYILSYDEAFNEIIRYGSELIPVFTFEATETDVIKGAETIENILRPLVGARTVFGITGLIILMFFTQGLLHSFKHVLFDVFDIDTKTHPVLDIIYNFLGFGVLGSVFLFSSLFAGGYLFCSSISSYFSSFSSDLQFLSFHFPGLNGGLGQGWVLSHSTSSSSALSSTLSSTSSLCSFQITSSILSISRNISDISNKYVS